MQTQQNSDYLKSEMIHVCVVLRYRDLATETPPPREKLMTGGLKADTFSTLACYLKCDTICPSPSPSPWTSLGQAPGAAAFPLARWPGGDRE